MSDIDGSFLGGMFILLLIFMALYLITVICDDTKPVNCTETVVYKDISHVREQFGDSNQYNIYTNNNSFKVDLTDYNNIQEGDNLTVEYEKGLLTPKLYFENRIYYGN